MAKQKTYQKGKKVDATIAILCLNGEEFLDSLLKAATTQKTKRSYEVLVIDSGSTDRTLEIVRSYPEVRLVEIPNTEFGHGKTRNFAAQISDSEFMVYLTQDAVPSHEEWLEYMLEPFFMSDKVGCVVGKQIPRADCFPTLKREVASVFQGMGADHSVGLQRKTELTDRLGLTLNFMSDVNSAVRRSFLVGDLPFRDVNYAEDQAMGEDMLKAGFLKAYAPLGSVLHSHNYPLKKYFKRKFDEAVGLRKATGHIMHASLKELYIGSLKSTLRDWMFIARDRDYSWKRKLHGYVLAPCYNYANRLAMRKAERATTQEAIDKHSLEVAARKKARN